MNQTWLTAVDTFIKGCKSDGIWGNLLDVGLLCGCDTLGGSLIKLKTPVGVARTLVNNNFVSGDYAATGASAGLLGNGSTKYLETSSSIISFDKSNFSMGVYAVNGSNALGGMIGASYNATGDTDRFYIGRSGASILQAAVGNLSPAFLSSTPGMFSFQTTGTTGYSRFKNGASESTLSTWNNNGFQSGTVRVFKGGGAQLGNDRVMFYFIGQNLNQAALSNRVNALMATIGASQY